MGAASRGYVVLSWFFGLTLVDGDISASQKNQQKWMDRRSHDSHA